MTRKAIITPRQAEVLSYLTGKGPVGTLVRAKRSEMCEDLGLSSSGIAHYVTALVHCGLVRREGQDTFVVLRRVESRRVIIRSYPSQYMRPGYVYSDGQRVFA